MSTNTVGHRITPSLQTGLTALGSTQSTAFPLTNNTWHEFTTVASGTGAILPAGKTPSEVRVFNDSANPLRVYPPVGGTINAGTVNLPVSLAAGNGLTYWASSLSNWYSIQTVSSGSATLPGGISGQIQPGIFRGFVHAQAHHGIHDLEDDKRNNSTIKQCHRNTFCLRQQLREASVGTADGLLRINAGE